MHFVALDKVGLGKYLSDLGCKRASCGNIVGIALQYCKLITAETRHCVVLAGCVNHATCNLPQQRIADSVAKRVVDVLEVIDIEIEDGERIRATTTRGKRSAKPF